MEATPEHHIVEEYLQLLEKSQQLFAGLRDLPPFGKQWQPYFQRCFEIYTRLWKFQQQNRATLENKDVYGIKRWEIGEIASKIGQLYYHFYLRTSDVRYLEEAFIFYDAIRTRGYFREASEPKSPSLMIKKLRYYARFIVVCLLLDRRPSVKDLVDELEKLVEEYARLFKPSDTQEWQFVLQEIVSFLQGSNILAIIDRPKNVPPISFRLARRSQISGDGPRVKLQEAILVGNYQHQVKFSELTLDMFRMMQSMEEVSHNTDSSKLQDEGSMKKRGNPHKYLLYRPSFSQLIVFLSNAFKEVENDGVLLLYLSADGLRFQPKDGEGRYPSGGISLGIRNANPNSATSRIQTLCVDDIIPYTRKNFFLIVDSENSASFKSIPNVFGTATLCLLSPTSYPAEFKDVTVTGNLFSLFLHSPLVAFCYVVGITEITQEGFDTATRHINRTFDELHKALISSEIPTSFLMFMEDEFLKLFILRFIFCHAVFSHHKSFQDKPECLPQSTPEVPSSILSHGSLTTLVSAISNALGAKALSKFNLSSAKEVNPTSPQTSSNE